MTREEIMEMYPDEDFIFLTEYDDAIMGVDMFSFGVVYSKNHIIEAIMMDGTSYEDALEHFDYNIIGSHHSQNAPIYVETDWFKPTIRELRKKKLERVLK